MQTEAQIQAQILRKLGKRTDCRVFRNTVGVAHVGQPPLMKRISFGLAPGSADIIGIHSYTIQPEDVGRTAGVFMSIEVKRDFSSKIHSHQLNWMNMVNRLGGFGCITNDCDIVAEDLMNWRPQ